jgi:hypothetical protein
MPRIVFGSNQPPPPPRQPMYCSLATQFQTRALESILRPLAGLKFPTLKVQIPFLSRTLSLPHLGTGKGEGWGLDFFKIFLL